MKGIILFAASLLLTACFHSSTEIVPYRQVAVVPSMETVTPDVDYSYPLDMTRTTIGYY